MLNILANNRNPVLAKAWAALKDPYNVQSPVPDAQFLKAMLEFFKKTAPGDAAGQVHMGPLADEFNKLASVGTYYPYWEDNKVILENPGFYQELAATRRRPGEPVVLIELGPGHGTDKTRNILKLIRPDHYVMVDNSFACLQDTNTMVKAEFPDIIRHRRMADFYRDSIEFQNNIYAVDSYETAGGGKQLRLKANNDMLPQEGLRIVVQYGNTAGNRKGGFHEAFPEDGLVRDMRHIRHTMMRPGDIAIYGIDMNKDGTSVQEAYESEVNEFMVMATMWRVKKELIASGEHEYDPDKLVYIRMWNRKNMLFTHGVKVLADMNFTLGEERIHLKKGEILSFANSYRFNQELLDSIYPRTNQRRIAVLSAPEKRMHHQVLEAI